MASLDLLCKKTWGRNVIPVKSQPEPSNFSQLVRNRGLKFLKNNSPPNSWKGKEFWRKALPELCNAYSRICAYSAQWVPPVVGASTVDHFVPKKHAPQLAYEWSNFRLACSLLNSRKRDFQDVLDPFKIGNSWFILDFPSLQVKPGSVITLTESNQVVSTINRLNLNDEICITFRIDWLKYFCLGDISFNHLEEKAPFIAYELKRQNLVGKIISIMGF